MRQPRRVLVPAALIVALALAATLLLAPSGDHRVRMRLLDAGQLVRGNDVTVAGRPVGRVADVRLAPDRRAEVELRIDDQALWPLRHGTRAVVTAGGLAGRSNRSVALEPGDGPPIADGGLLDDADVRGLVDLDHVLATLDAPTRARLARTVRRTDAHLAGSGDDLRAALRAADPAAAAATDLLGDLADRDGELGRLLRSADALSATVAAHEDDLRAGLRDARRVVATVAARRDALSDLLARAPALVADGTRTLRAARRTVRRAGPTIDAAGPVVRPALALAERLRTGRVPLLRGLERAAALLDGLAPVVDRLPATMPAVTRGLEEARTTLRRVVPAMAQIAPYVPDVLAGFTGGFIGHAGGYYDANGHYGRLGIVLGGNLLEGLPTNLLPNLIGQQGIRTGLTARCPGAAAAPAPDGSNPWVPAGVDCDREDDQR